MSQWPHPMLILTTLWLTPLPRPAEGRPPDTPTRPNIIFLLTDDQRDNTLAGMGHPCVQTPRLDRLLQQSVRFRNTYIAEPVCAPSRVSLLTGMHERVHGVGFTSSYELTEAQSWGVNVLGADGRSDRTRRAQRVFGRPTPATQPEHQALTRH